MAPETSTHGVAGAACIQLSSEIELICRAYMIILRNPPTARLDGSRPSNLTVAGRLEPARTGSIQQTTSTSSDSSEFFPACPACAWRCPAKPQLDRTKSIRVDLIQPGRPDRPLPAMPIQRRRRFFYIFDYIAVSALMRAFTQYKGFR